MTKYEGVYKVTNPDWNQSLPELFDTFEKALRAQQGWDVKASIEQLNGVVAEVVWTPDYEDYVSEGLFF